MRPNSVIAGLVALTTAACGLQVLEELRGVPEGWTKIGSPAQDSKVLLHLNIVQDNEAALEETIMDVSTPGHPRYGQHLSLESMKALMQPSSSATDAVMSWLESSGIETAKDDGDYINFVATISQAEKLLNTKFDVYRSDINDVHVVRTLQYSIPDELHNTVYMIQPTTRFGEIRPHFSNVFDTHFRVGTDVDDSCNTTITPECLKELYNIKGPGLNTANGFLGVTGYLNEYARFADLDSFTSQFATYAEGTSFKVTRVNGSQFNQTSESDSVEANLDIQYGVGVGYPVPNHFYSTDGVGPLIPDLDQPDVATRQNEPYLQFLRYIVNLPDKKLPHTLTTSYGENEQSVPERYNRAVCRMFGQLGARGVSVLFSSGDTGVGSACQTNDGKNTTRFNPVFPAACPHLTSVGGVYHVKPERAISFSSGGFSDRFPRPAYQDTAVPAYLKILGKQWKGLYNPDGRGFPDVAAQAYNFSVVDKGKNILVGGTSASAPTFAAIIAKINSARIEAGKPGLGFLNPWIYGGAYKGLNDITVGGSTGCTGKSRYSGLPTPVVPYASWNATTGWDPVTGYGTPNVRKLLKLALKA